MTAFIFNRTISVMRPDGEAPPSGVTTVQLGGYSGVTAAAETEIYFDLPASIQPRSSVRQHVNSLPSDQRSPYVWSFYLKNGAVPVGGIKNRDIIVDDQGERYQVEASQWTLLGCHIRALMLEV